jgi:hypothetical protein
MCNHNRLDKCARHGAATLRYMLIITADPEAQGLTGEQQQAVKKLLNNEDGWHKTFFGATLTQAQHLFTAIKNEITGNN